MAPVDVIAAARAMKDAGRTTTEIAAHFHRHPRTVRDWLRINPPEAARPKRRRRQQSPEALVQVKSYLPPDLLADLGKESEHQCTSNSQLIANAVRFYVDGMAWLRDQNGEPPVLLGYRTGV
jgi:hypothetical protein